MYLSRYKHIFQLVVISITLVGTSIEATAAEQSPLQCRTAENAMQMTYKNAEAFRAYYLKKFIAGELHVSQMVCELGKPLVVKTANGQKKIEDISVQIGDRFVRWGESKTNDPVDEISISVVIDADDMVHGYANHFPFKKELKVLAKSEGRIAVTSGTYTREVITMAVPATK